MEAVAAAPVPSRALLAATAARVTVQASVVGGVVAGCWLMLMAQPAGAIAAATIFLLTFFLARWRFDIPALGVLFFAYLHAGLLLLFIPSFPAVSLWLAALAGLVTGGCSWRTWSAPTAWRWPLMLWLLGVALSWPIIAAREADFAVLMRGDGVGFVLQTAITTLCTGLWLDSALTWDIRTFEGRVARPLLAGVVIAAAAVCYQAFVDITWLNSEPWIQFRRAPGLMGDANPMAVAAALWAPLAPFVFRGRMRVVAGGAITVLLWYAAWLTGARSVILLAGAGAIGLAGGAIARRTTPRRAVLFAAAAACVGLFALLALSRLPAAGPISRLAATLPLDRPADLAYEVLWRRDGYGLAAVRAIREHPWSGVGHGAFYVLSNYYYRLEGGPLVPPDNAQNLWRHALAERGVLAFAAVLGLTFVSLRMLFRPAPNVPIAYSWTLKAMVIGLALALVFGLPIQNPAIALTAAALVAWLYSAVAPAAPSRAQLSGALVAVVWLLAVAGGAVDAWNARGDLRPPWRAARIGDPYLYGFGEIEIGPRGVSGRIVSDYAVVALRPAGPRYNLRCWVRGSDARHVRIWHNQRLVMDELLPAGVIIDRLLESPMAQPMLLEFDTNEPGIVVTGDFVR